MGSEIGWSNESYLLNDILKSLKRLTQVYGFTSAAIYQRIEDIENLLATQTAFTGYAYAVWTGTGLVVFCLKAEIPIATFLLPIVF